MPSRNPTSLQDATTSQPLAEVLDSISDAFFVLDRAWRFTYLNRAAERVFQRPREDLLGRGIWDEFPEADGLDFGREYRRALEEQATVHFEEYFPPLGTWFEVRAYPTPGGLSVYFQDVGERRRMREELRYSEERHRSVFETMAQGVVFLDARGRIEYANPAASRILGHPASPIRGMEPSGPAWQAVREDGTDFPGHEHPSMVALGSGEPVRGVVMGIFNPSVEEVRWISVNAVPLLRQGAARPHGVHCVFEDITERKRSEQALRRSEQRYRSLVDASSSIVWTTDGSGSVVSELPSWEAFTGQGLADYMVRGWLGAIHPHDRDRAVTAWGRALESTDPFEAEFRILRRDGAYRLVACRGVPVLGADGAIREWVGTCDDVTEQRTAEASLRRAKEEAERANGAKDEFIAVLSHELRTPLTPVLLTISMMEAHPGLPAEFREDVAAIRRNVELESRLIGDLLDLTRIAKGKMELNFEPVDLHVAIRTAIEICQREEAVRLVADLNATRHLVHGDPTRLQQVFWNLINNAQKFTTREGGTILVRTSDAGDDRIRAEVTDYGVGIDPAILPRLFDAFEQGDIRAGRSFAGLGLGLAISRKLVDAHGGTIVAMSEGKGRGATFVVELRTIRYPSARLDAPTMVPESSVPGEAVSILLVEDHVATQRILARLLGRLGHHVTTASSVASGLAACTQRSFDLILSDLGLPDGSGLDLIRNLGADYRGRAVALTGYGMESDIRASREAGFADHLTKPVDLEALATTIGRVLLASRTDPDAQFQGLPHTFRETS